MRPAVSNCSFALLNTHVGSPGLCPCHHNLPCTGLWGVLVGRCETISDLRGVSLMGEADGFRSYCMTKATLQADQHREVPGSSGVQNEGLDLVGGSG